MRVMTLRTMSSSSTNSTRRRLAAAGRVPLIAGVGATAAPAVFRSAADGSSGLILFNRITTLPKTSCPTGQDGAQAEFLIVIKDLASGGSVPTRYEMGAQSPWPTG